MGKAQQRLRTDPFSLPCRMVIPLDFMRDSALKDMLLRWRSNFRTGTSRGRIDKRVYGELLSDTLQGHTFNYVCILDQNRDEEDEDWGEMGEILRKLVGRYDIKLSDLDPDMRQAKPPFLKVNADGYLYFDEKEYKVFLSLRDCRLWLSTDPSLTPKFLYLWQMFNLIVEWYVNGACLPAVPQHLLKGLDPQWQDALALMFLKIYWLEILHLVEFRNKTGKDIQVADLIQLGCVYDRATGEYVFTRKLKATERLYLKTLDYLDIARQE